MAPGAAGEADGSRVSPGASGARGLSCLRAGPGTGGKGRARGHSWGWERPSTAPLHPTGCISCSSAATLTAPAGHTEHLQPSLCLLHAGVPCWAVLTNPVQVAGEHSVKCPNADLLTPKSPGRLEGQVKTNPAQKMIQ